MRASWLVGLYWTLFAAAIALSGCKPGDSDGRIEGSQPVPSINDGTSDNISNPNPTPNPTVGGLDKIVLAKISEFNESEKFKIDKVEVRAIQADGLLNKAEMEIVLLLAEPERGGQQ